MAFTMFRSEKSLILLLFWHEEEKHDIVFPLYICQFMPCISEHLLFLVHTDSPKLIVMTDPTSHVRNHLLGCLIPDIYVMEPVDVSRWLISTSQVTTIM